MSTAGKAFLHSFRGRLFPIAFLFLVVARAAAAAECAHYRVLVEADALDDFESTLDRDTKNRACAFYLAMAYQERGEERRAVQWINYARLFANAEQDPEIYTEILYYKLLWDPDSASEQRGYPAVRDYDPQRDLDRLESMASSLAGKLRAEARSRFERETGTYLGSPWGKPCPSGRSFWGGQARDVASRVDSVCRSVEDCEELEKRAQDRATVDGILKALEILDGLGIDVSRKEIRFHQLQEYYRLETEARARALSSERRAELLGDALNALERGNGQDVENVTDRRRKYLLMAEIERELAKKYGRPDSRTVDLWRRTADSLFSTLPDDYRLALDLLDGHQACLDSDKEVSLCRRFIEDRRWKNVGFAEATLERLRGEGRQILRSRISRGLDSFESLLTTDQRRDISSDDIVAKLELLQEEHSDYVDVERLARLLEMAQAERGRHEPTERLPEPEATETPLPDNLEPEVSPAFEEDDPLVLDPYRPDEARDSGRPAWLRWTAFLGVAAAVIVSALLFLMFRRRRDDPQLKEDRSLVDVPPSRVAPGIHLETRLMSHLPPSSTFFDLIERVDGTYGLYLVEVNEPDPNATETARHVKDLLCQTPGWGLGEPEAQLEKADELLSQEGLQVMMSFIEIDPRKKEVRYAAAGLPSLFVLGKDGAGPVELKAFGRPLGNGYAEKHGAARRHDLQDGDILFALNNGVRQVFTSERLAEALAPRARSPAELVNAGLELLRPHAAGDRAAHRKEWALLACRVEAPVMSEWLDAGIPVLFLKYEFEQTRRLAVEGSLASLLLTRYELLLGVGEEDLVPGACIVRLEAIADPDIHLAETLVELLEELRKREASLVCVGYPAECLELIESFTDVELTLTDTLEEAKSLFRQRDSFLEGGRRQRNPRDFD